MFSLSDPVSKASALVFLQLSNSDKLSNVTPVMYEMQDVVPLVYFRFYVELSWKCCSVKVVLSGLYPTGCRLLCFRRVRAKWPKWHWLARLSQVNLEWFSHKRPLVQKVEAREINAISTTPI